MVFANSANFGGFKRIGELGEGDGELIHPAQPFPVPINGLVERNFSRVFGLLLMKGGNWQRRRKAFESLEGLARGNQGGHANPPAQGPFPHFSDQLFWAGPSPPPFARRRRLMGAAATFCLCDHRQPFLALAPVNLIAKQAENDWENG